METTEPVRVSMRRWGPWSPLSERVCGCGTKESEEADRVGPQARFDIRRQLKATVWQDSGEADSQPGYEVLRHHRPYKLVR